MLGACVCACADKPCFYEKGKKDRNLVISEKRFYSKLLCDCKYSISRLICIIGNTCLLVKLRKYCIAQLRDNYACVRDGIVKLAHEELKNSIRF